MNYYEKQLCLLADLAEKHRLSQLPTTASRDGVKQAMFQLLSHNTSTQELIKEGTYNDNVTVSTTGLETPTTSLSVEILIKSLEDDSVAMGASVAMAAAVTLANHLQALLSHDQNDLLLTEEQRSQFVIVESVVERLQGKGNFNKNTFIKIINKEMVLPTEAVWRLHTAGIMLLDVFITCNLSKPRVIGSLSANIVKLCEAREQTSKSTRIKIVQGIVCYLITQAYGDRSTLSDDATSKGLKKVSVALLDSITKKMLGCYFEHKSFDIHLYLVVMTAPPVADNSALKRYCTQQLSLILGYNPVIKVSAALQQQEQWSYVKADGFVKETLSQLLCMFDAEEAITILRQVLEQHEVNWQMLLTYCSTVLVCYQAAPPAMSKLIRDLLCEGLEMCQVDGIIAGFLLARQASGEGLHILPAYEDWFNTMFGDPPTSLANNKKSFTFLMKFLTDIVPFEAPKYLKAHLLKPPFVPGKCRPIFSDYITLAKTRLMDLKEPLEELGIYGNDRNSRSEKVIEQASQDVDKALINFEKTGKVPASIMEASIFRKPYFVGRFLPALLTPRPLPDNDDVRMKFIEALHQAEKIPPSLYTTYQKACDKMAAQLLEGVFSDEEDDMDDMLLSPWQQLCSSFTALQEAIHSQKDAEKQICLTSHISIISEKITNYLPAAPHGGLPGHDPDITQGSLLIDLSVVSTQKDHIRVVHELCAMTFDLDKVAEDNIHTEWRLQFLSMLTSHKLLWWTFCVDLLQKLVTKNSSSSLVGVRSSAVTLFYIFTYADILPAPPVRHNGLSVPYKQYVCTVLTPSCQHRMLFLLQLWYYYLHYELAQYSGVQLHYASHHRGAVLPGEIVTMFTYLSERIISSVDQFTSTCLAYQTELDDIWPGGTQLVVAFCNSDLLKPLVKQHQMSLKHWVELELEINPVNDLLNQGDRHRYLETKVLGHYLPQPANEEGCNHDIFLCMSTLFEAVLDSKHQTIGCEPMTGECNCVPSQSTRGNSQSEIILLLQKLINVVTMQSESRTSPWLPCFIMHRITSIEPDDIWHCSDEVISSFCLVQQFPAYLLLGNCPQQLAKQSPEGAIELVTLINDHWSQHLTTGVVLSLECTSHIIQCLLCLCPENPVLAQHILHTCPCILPGIMYHWESLIYLRNLIIEGATTPPFSHLLQYPEVLFKELNSMIKKEGVLQEFSARLDTDLWHMGVILYKLIKNSSSEKIDRLQQLLCKWSETNFLELGKPDPVLTCTVCLLADMARHLLYEQEMNLIQKQVLQLVWGREPYILVNCIQMCVSIPDASASTGSMCPSSDTVSGSGSMYALIPDTGRKLIPVVLCRLLVSLPTEELLNQSQTTGLLHGILIVYVKCSQIYDGNRGQINQQYSAFSQPVRMCDLIQLSMLIQSMLRRSTQVQVSNLPQSLLSNCDADIKKTVAQTLRR